MKQLVSFQCSLACATKIDPSNVLFSVVPKFDISSRYRERVAFAAIETYRCSFRTSKDPKAWIMVILTKVCLQSWSCRTWLSMHGIWDSTVLGGSRQVAYVGLGSILELLKWVFFSSLIANKFGSPMCFWHFTGTSFILQSWDTVSLFSQTQCDWWWILIPTRCEANSISATKDVRAHDALYINIAEYFRPACSLEGDEKVINTNLPPIYFQHQGMTPCFFQLKRYCIL